MLYGHEVFLHLDDADMRLAPRASLPQAERLGLLPALDIWVLVRLAGLLSEHEPPAHPVRFHLNVAGASLLDANYRNRLTTFMREGAFAPGQLCLELKASEACANIESLRPVLGELAQLGVGLMLEEYGRGLGDLDALRKLPLSSVKLDGSLVQGVTSDKHGSAIVRAMADLARAMNVAVIAPQIENAAVLRLLQEAGADFAQGFLLGQPRECWAPAAHPEPP